MPVGHWGAHGLAGDANGSSGLYGHDYLPPLQESSLSVDYSFFNTSQIIVPTFSPGLAGHLSSVDKFTQKSGISGGHNADNFYEAVDKYGVKIISETPTEVDGITQIKYKIPALDRDGNVIGYKSAELTKTIYDPKKYTDEKIFELGNAAAIFGYKSAIDAGLREYSSSAGGIRFHIYLDKETGSVKNFFPETKE